MRMHSFTYKDNPNTDLHFFFLYETIILCVCVLVRWMCVFWGVCDFFVSHFDYFDDIFWGGDTMTDADAAFATFTFSILHNKFKQKRS